MTLRRNSVPHIIQHENELLNNLPASLAGIPSKLRSTDRKAVYSTWTLAPYITAKLDKYFICYSTPKKLAAIITHDTRLYKPAASSDKYIHWQFNSYKIRWAFDTATYQQQPEDNVLVSFRARYCEDLYIALVMVCKISARELTMKHPELS